MSGVLVYWDDVVKAVEGSSLDPTLKKYVEDTVAAVSQGRQVEEADIKKLQQAVTSSSLPAPVKRSILDVLKDVGSYVAKHDGTPFNLMAAGAGISAVVLTALGIPVPEWLVYLVVGSGGAGITATVKGKSGTSSS